MDMYMYRCVLRYGHISRASGYEGVKMAKSPLVDASQMPRTMPRTSLVLRGRLVTARGNLLSMLKRF